MGRLAPQLRAPLTPLPQYLMQHGFFFSVQLPDHLLAFLHNLVLRLPSMEQSEMRFFVSTLCKHVPYTMTVVMIAVVSSEHSQQVPFNAYKLLS